MRNLINILDFSTEELQGLMDTANDIIDHPEAYRERCRGKKLATLFFEPSTRTRLSFEAAMYELGGNIIGFSEAQSSSAAKGESVAKEIEIYQKERVQSAPVDGEISKIIVHEGELCNTGYPIITIVKLDDIWIVV